MLGLLGERGEDWEVEREALPARGPGRDRDVLTALRCLPGRRLVRVELGDPARLEPLAQSGRQIVGQRSRDRVPSSLGAEIRELLALEQIVPLRHADSHEADGSLGLPGCLVAEAENTPAEPDPGHAGEGS